MENEQKRGPVKNTHERIKGLLTKEKIIRLNENGFLWDKYDADWLKNYQKLLTFRQENPNRWPTRGKKMIKTPMK